MCVCERRRCNTPLAIVQHMGPQKLARRRAPTVTFLGEFGELLHGLELLLAFLALEFRDGLLEELGVRSVTRVLGDAVVVLPHPRVSTCTEARPPAQLPETTHLASQKSARQGREHRRSDGIVLVERPVQRWSHASMSATHTHGAFTKPPLTHTPSRGVRGGTCYERHERCSQKPSRRYVLVLALLSDRGDQAQLGRNVWMGKESGGCVSRAARGESDVGCARTVGFFDVARGPLRCCPVERLRAVAASPI